MDTIKKVLEEISLEIKSKDFQDNYSVPSGINILDNFTKGFKSGELILVAGYLGMGHFDFIKSIVLNTAMVNKKPVVVFSESDRLSYVKKMLSNELKISKCELIDDDIDNYKRFGVEEKISKLLNVPIYLEKIDVFEFSIFRDEVKKIKRQKDLKLLVLEIFNISKLKGKSIQNYKQNIQKLKSLALELNIPIIICNNIKEDKNLESIKRPNLNTLEELKTISKNSDMVLLFFRPEYYHISYWKGTKDSTANQVEISIEKNSNNWLANFIVGYNPHYGYFYEINKNKHDRNVEIFKKPFIEILTERVRKFLKEKEDSNKF